MYLVGNNHLLSTRHFLPNQNRIKTTKEILGIDKNENKTKTFLQQILTSLSKRKKKTSPKLNISNTKKRATMPKSVSRKKTRNQKTSVSLDKLYIGDCS